MHGQKKTSKLWNTKFHTHTKQQNYTSVYFNLHVIRRQTVRQKILHRMTAGNPAVQTAINSPKRVIFVCMCCSQGRNKPEGLPTRSPDSVDANTEHFTHRMCRTQILEHKKASAATLRYPYSRPWHTPLPVICSYLALRYQQPVCAVRQQLSGWLPSCPGIKKYNVKVKEK